ncbi:hypothetical protein SAMD00019534_034210 [Acytostelium subglobosum LB1]|uniref:hypothetical protein n=1 Tax=Acytostelium subglobosum LB1 TaxID=1410327 RepID=UPI00064491FA|nr:hypothetical protein SAMD00019534_034210 [Acytostelium subglobosum LB1]GAM20246.1 hypothetical protein SAMD00019534_034210 [Acytostelium subglobosum LB1]|eukprot:XP_012759767.1 hypothetical protein SAMD00019534_034210 [Acytostelium subglobosum LB1]
MYIPEFLPNILPSGLQRLEITKSTLEPMDTTNIPEHTILVITMRLERCRLDNARQLILPPTLVKLTLFDSKVITPLNTGILPPTLMALEIGYGFKHKFGKDTLPPSLTELLVHETYPHGLEHAPSSLKYIGIDRQVYANPTYPWCPSTLFNKALKSDQKDKSLWLPFHPNIHTYHIYPFNGRDVTPPRVTQERIILRVLDQKGTLLLSDKFVGMLIPTQDINFTHTKN